MQIEVCTRLLSISAKLVRNFNSFEVHDGFCCASGCILRLRLKFASRYIGRSSSHLAVYSPSSWCTRSNPMKMNRTRAYRQLESLHLNRTESTRGLDMGHELYRLACWKTREQECILVSNNGYRFPASKCSFASSNENTRGRTICYRGVRSSFRSLTIGWGNDLFTHCYYVWAWACETDIKI